MNIKYLLPLMAAAALCVATGCRRGETNELVHNHEHHEHEGAEGHEGHHHEEGEADEHEAHEDGVIVLSPEQAVRFGVKVEKTALAPINNVIKVGGTVNPAAGASAVAASPTAGIVTLAPGIEQGAKVSAGTLVATVRADAVAGGDAGRIAAAELEAARTEFERIEPLYQRRLVTRARYNEAKAAYDRARAAYSAAGVSGRVLAPISGVITALNTPTGSYVDVGGVIASVAASGLLTLTAQVPARLCGRLSSVTDARVVMPDGSALTLSEHGGRRLNPADAAASGSAGYVPVSFSFDNDGTVVPGSAVEVYLLGTSSRQAITVPRSAISEQQGDYFVYERLDEDCYRKVPVVLGEDDGDRVEIKSGLQPGTDVVTGGVTTVKLAGASGAVPAGHSHSH